MDPRVRPRLVLREHWHFLDWALILLALGSLLLFLMYLVGGLAGIERSHVLVVDLAMSGAYAAIFLLKWSMAGHHSGWLRRHLTLAPGMLPLTFPVLPEPWALLHIVVILGLRVGKALDRAFGDHVSASLTERYKSMVVEELAEPLLMRLAVLLEESVTSRDYAAAMGRSLKNRQDLVDAAVKRAIASSPKLQMATRFPPVKRLVDETTQEVVDAAHAALTGPELNTLIREAFREAFAELKSGIEERKWPHRGVGITEVAHGLSAPLLDGPAGAPPPPPPSAAAPKAAPARPDPVPFVPTVSGGTPLP